MTFLYNECAALLYKLRGITVYDVNNPDGLQVPVRFRLPEDELASMTYPIIILEINGLSLAEDRQFSGGSLLPYAPEGYPIWWSPDATDFDPTDSPYRYYVAPTAYNIDYRVSVYSRLVRDHLLPITARLMQADMLTARGAYLNVPQDGTSRHVSVLAGPKTSYANVDADDNQKRFVTNSWLIRVPTEIVNDITDLSPAAGYARATQILVDIEASLGDLNDTNLQELTESIGIISAGVSLGWNTLAN